MGKQWIYLIVLAFILMGFFAAWDIVSTITGGRDEFRYTLQPISPNLYEGLEEHFGEGNDPNYPLYEQAANQIGGGLEYFAPPNPEFD